MSAQRYWGEPFPVVFLEDGTCVPLPDGTLPTRSFARLFRARAAGRGAPSLRRPDSAALVSACVCRALRNACTSCRLTLTCAPRLAATAMLPIRLPPTDKFKCACRCSRPWQPVPVQRRSGPFSARPRCYAPSPCPRARPARITCRDALSAEAQRGLSAAARAARAARAHAFAGGAKQVCPRQAGPPAM